MLSSDEPLNARAARVVTPYGIVKVPVFAPATHINVSLSKEYIQLSSIVKCCPSAGALLSSIKFIFERLVQIHEGYF